MTLYELATLGTRFGGAGRAAPAIRDYLSAPGAKGRLLGAWASEIGRLNQVFVLRAFDDRDDLIAERWRARSSADPFGCGDDLVTLSLDSYVPLDFVPPVEPGDFGPFYEIRTYRLKPSGEVPTQEAWRKAVPARMKYSPLLVAMFSTDGEPRFTHIWPYRSLDERHAIRANAVADGLWPPQGAPDWAPEMNSSIALPLSFSPLR